MKSISKKMFISSIIILLSSLLFVGLVANADTPIAAFDPAEYNLNDENGTAYVGYTPNNYGKVFYVRPQEGSSTIYWDEDHRKVEFTSGNTDAFDMTLTGGTMTAPSRWDGGTITPKQGLSTGSYSATFTFFYDESGTKSNWTEICSGTVSFTVEKCTVTLDPNNGTTETYPAIDANDPTMTLAMPEDYGFTTPNNKEFDGWLVGEAKYNNGESFPVTSNVTAVAQWKDATPATPTSTNVVSNFEELQTALSNSEYDEVIVTTDITLPNGTVLDGLGKTVRVANPYVNEDGSINESASESNIFNINSSSTVTIKNMTIMGGKKSGLGAISNSGNLTLENVNVVRSNRGLDNDGGFSILRNCNFSKNVCISAAAVWNGNGARLVLDGCSFTENRSNGGSSYGGGAIGVSGSSSCLYANNTVFANNATQEVGGAINIYDGTAYLLNCTVSGNCTSASANYGGGIGKNGGSLYAANCVFIDNYANINSSKVRSDIGVYSGSNGVIYNSVYSKVQGSLSTNNCKEDDSNTIASAYTESGIILSEGTTSTAFSHPVLTTGTNSHSKYVIVKNTGSAATGGINTYFDYSDTSSIKMGFGEDSNITAWVGSPTSDNKVSTYYGGGTRIAGIMGASAADGPIVTTHNVVVTVEGNGTASADPTSGEQGTTVTLTAAPTDAENYRFKEWQVISGGVTIDSNNQFTIGTSDVEIKAVFEEIPTHTVTFKDGDNTLYTQQVKDGEYATRPVVDPSKENLVFSKWCIDSTLTTEFTFGTTAITLDTIIYAKWADIYEVSTWAELQAALNQGGTIVLTQDIIAESTDTTLGTRGKAILDLNGFIIDAKEYMAPVLRVNERTELTLIDSNPNRTHSPEITYKNPITNEDVVVNGGIITGGKNGDWGNGIDVPRSTFTMNGGTIVGNNTNSGSGAGVFVHSVGTFNLNGGLIAGNYSAGSGGGVFLYDRCTFNMNGGSIKHNSADGKGGGVYLWNNQTGYYETLNMSGGSIEENKATSGGGGIYVDTRGVLNVSGNPIIIGNKSGDAKSNVYSGLNVTGPLTDGANIGITTAYVPWAGDFNIFTNGYGTYNTIDPGQYFVSDYDNVAVVARENYNGIVEAALTLNYTVTVSAEGNGTAEANISSGTQGTEVTLTATPTDTENYRFKEWQVISGGVTINENKFTIGTSNVEIKAIFEEIPTHTVTFKDGENVLYTQNVKDGQYATRPETDPTKEYVTFNKWCIDSTLTIEFIFGTTAITSDMNIYAKWDALPFVSGKSIWRTASDTATIRFHSATAGTYYYVVTNSNTAPTATTIKEETSGVHDSGPINVGTNPINLTGLSAGAQYLHIVVEQNGTFSNVLTIEMPYDAYFFDNYDSYVSNTRIDGLDSYTLKYNGTGAGNQIIISSEQKDGTTGNALQLQGRSSWASDVRHSFTSDDKQYVIFEADMKSVSGTDPGGVNFGSSSAGGYWTSAICRAGLGQNNKFWYGKNDESDNCDTDLTHSNGNWYNLKMILDNTNDVFYVCVDNVFINTIPYEADSATPEWFSLGGGNNGTNTIYYDDVKVYTTDTVEIPTPSYIVKVNNGSSSPNMRAEENTIVTITANEGTNGAEFYKWMVLSGGITLTSDTSPTTTFTMGTERVEVTAMYKYTIQDQITYQLWDSYGDGWHGNNKIIIEDASNDNPVETLTISGGSALNGTTQNLVPGHTYNLLWIMGSWPGECGFTLKDKDGKELITRDGYDNSTTSGIFLTIEVEEPEYTVKFETYGGGTIADQTVVYGRKATEPTVAPSRTGYEFTRWCADAEMSTAFDFNQEIKSDKTVYAGYRKDVRVDNTTDDSEATIIGQVKLTDLADNSETTVKLIEETIATTYIKPLSDEVLGKINSAKTTCETYITTNEFTNKGTENLTEENSNWDNRADPTATESYSSEENAIIRTYVTNGSYGKKMTYTTTIYAEHDSRPLYEVTFKDGDNVISTQQVRDGGKVTKPSNPSKDGYKFMDWYMDSTFSTKFDFETTAIEDNTTIYAKWAQIIGNIKVSLSDGMNISAENFNELQAYAIDFLTDKGVLICENNEDESVDKYYDKDNNLLFTYNGETNIINFAEGTGYLNNIEYTLTDEEKRLSEEDGVSIDKIVLSFGDAPFEYLVIEGQGQNHNVSSGSDARFKANGKLSKFLKLLIDRNEVSKDNYTEESGSTIVTLKSAFLDTLSEGTHELTFVYTDGECSTNFTISKANNTEIPTPVSGDTGTAVAGSAPTLFSSSPSTGDKIYFWIILLITSSIVFATTETYLRKNK